MSKCKMGTVGRRGESWVIDYYIKCDRIRETIKGASTESQAGTKLKVRISQIHTNTSIWHEEKLGIEDLVKLIEDEYQLKQRRGVRTMGVHVEHLREFFRHYLPSRSKLVLLSSIKNIGLNKKRLQPRSTGKRHAFITCS
jgi:hypothetical protein